MHYAFIILSIVFVVQSERCPSSDPQALKIATKPVTPLLIHNTDTQFENEEFTGYYVEYFDSLSKYLNKTYCFNDLYTSNSEILEAVDNGTADVGLAMSISSERINNFDFSLPIIGSYLQIMTYNDVEKNLFSFLMPFHWGLWLMVIASIIVVGHIMWFLERGKDFPKNYISGAREGIWWSSLTIFKSNDKKVDTLPGKILKFGYSFVGMIIVASYTAGLATFLLQGTIKMSIQEPADLIGKKVGCTTQSSIGCDWISSYKGINKVVYKTLDEMFEAMLNRSVYAVVHDSPILIFFARSNANDRGISIVPFKIAWQTISLAFHKGSPYTSLFNEAIVNLTTEARLQDKLEQKWIGVAPSGKPAQVTVYTTAGLWVWTVIWIVLALIAYILKKKVIKKKYKKSTKEVELSEMNSKA